MDKILENKILLILFDIFYTIPIPTLICYILYGFGINNLALHALFFFIPWAILATEGKKKFKYQKTRYKYIIIFLPITIIVILFAIINANNW